MKGVIKQAVKKTFAAFNIGIVKTGIQLLANRHGRMLYFAEIAEFCGSMNDNSFQAFQQSKGQLLQDFFVASHYKHKRGGYFVEFGATNGIDLSNTFLLETMYGWRGILAEPAKCWYPALENNRKVVIDKRCVWHKTGEKLTFLETNSKELSTIAAFTDADRHNRHRGEPLKYDVETVSLLDLLNENKAPKHIDFLSLDTEGSELDILTSFDFDKYSFGVICVEHNYTANREKIHSLLTCKGYKRVLEHISFYDDWYIRNDRN